METNRRASLAATQQRQELVDKLAKARGRSALTKLTRELSSTITLPSASGAGVCYPIPPPSLAFSHLTMNPLFFERRRGRAAARGGSGCAAGFRALGGSSGAAPPGSAAGGARGEGGAAVVGAGEASLR